MGNGKQSLISMDNSDMAKKVDLVYKNVTKICIGDSLIKIVDKDWVVCKIIMGIFLMVFFRRAF